jgi:hypothetical protein
VQYETASERTNKTYEEEEEGTEGSSAIADGRKSAESAVVWEGWWKNGEIAYCGVDEDE